MARELSFVQSVERSISKTYRERLWTPFITAIKNYKLIEEGDKIAVCISGGKDSMLMAKLIQMLHRHSDVKFDVEYLVMDPGYNEINRQKIESNAKLLEIPITVFETNIFDVANNTERSPCYVCAKMRRGHLYHKAKDLGCNKIALGHHLSDVIETTVMAMFYGSQLQGMMPKLHSLNFGGMELIRPMYCINEQDIINWKNYNGLQFIQCACRFTESCTVCDNGGGGSKRQEMCIFASTKQSKMSFFTRKYPVSQSNILLDCAMYGAIVFLILYVLQPFGVNMYKGNKFLVSLLFGAITFGCCYLFELAIKPLHKKTSPWLVWHEALSVLANVLFIGFCNFIACSLLFHYPISFSVFLQFLYWTLIIGIIITVFSVGFSYYRHLRNQLESLIDKTTEEQTDVVVTIHDTSVRGNDLQLPINDLLYIEAQKNNVSVCYMKDDKAHTSVLHTTLTSVLTDLHEYENIFQCHRSFVVNLNNISSARGNSNGYQLKLGNDSTIIPVSRTYVPKLRSFIA